MQDLKYWTFYTEFTHQRELCDSIMVSETLFWSLLFSLPKCLHHWKKLVLSLFIRSCSFTHTDFQLMQMSHLLLNILTPLLKGLITLHNSRLTSPSAVLTVLCPVAAAASVFLLCTCHRGSRSAHVGLFFPTVDLHRAVGKSESGQC